MIEKILLRAPSELKMILKKETERMGITMNALILQILWNWVKEVDAERTA